MTCELKRRSPSQSANHETVRAQVQPVLDPAADCGERKLADSCASPPAYSWIMLRQAPFLRRIVGIGAAVLLVIGAAGCAPRSGSELGSAHGGGNAGLEHPFPEGAPFDYQLGGAYDPPGGTKLVVRDRSADPAPGIYSICYINAFQTQPGELADWPAAAILRDADGPVTDPEWPDETLLDTSTPEKRGMILDRIRSWIAGCAADGFQAVEFDNLDSFVRSGGTLTFADNLALATELAKIAHEAGLAAGQKNNAEHARELRETARFDFAVAEECAAFEECDAYAKAYGGAVIDIEYEDALPRSFDEMCSDPESPASMILRDRDLVPAESPRYLFERCPPK